MKWICCTLIAAITSTMLLPTPRGESQSVVDHIVAWFIIAAIVAFVLTAIREDGDTN